MQISALQSPSTQAYGGIKAANGAGAPAAAAASASTLAARYDVRDMTQSQLAALGDELCANGTLAPTEACILSMKPPGEVVRGADGQALEVKPHEDDGRRHDYLTEYQQRLDFNSRLGFDDPALRKVVRVLEGLAGSGGAGANCYA